MKKHKVGGKPQYREKRNSMKAIFELQTKADVDMAIFAHMKEKATVMLSDAESCQYTQAVVLRSALGNEYGAVIPNVLSEDRAEEASLIQRLKEAKDTEIDCVLCVWQDQSIDIPSFSFRERLLALNSKNSEALLFVMTGDGVSGTKLFKTMK